MALLRCSDAQPRVPRRHNGSRTRAFGPSASRREPLALATSVERTKPACPAAGPHRETIRPASSYASRRRTERLRIEPRPRPIRQSARRERTQNDVPERDGFRTELVRMRGVVVGPGERIITGPRDGASPGSVDLGFDMVY